MRMTRPDWSKIKEQSEAAWPGSSLRCGVRRADVLFFAKTSR